MSFCQWRGRRRIAEVCCRLPISDLRHILQMFTDKFVVAAKLLVEETYCILGLQAKARYVLQRVKRKVKAAHFVEHNHVKRSCGRSAVYITVHMEAAFIGAAMNQGMNEPAIIVEGKDHGRCFGEESVEGHFIHP